MRGVCVSCRYGNVDLDGTTRRCDRCRPASNTCVSWPEVIAATLQNHEMQDDGIACGCGDWRAWGPDGPNGLWEEHVTGHILKRLVDATYPETAKRMWTFGPWLGRTLSILWERYEGEDE